MPKSEGQKGNDKTSTGYEKILLGYDGSTNAKRALKRAAAIAAATGAQLRIVTVVNPVIPAYGPISVFPNDYVEQIEKDAHRSLAQAVKIARRVTTSVIGSVEEGHASDVILRLAESGAADLIILGRRGVSAIERFVMGGVSSSVVSHSKCDVLIVK